MDFPPVGYLPDVVGIKRFAQHVKDMAQHVVANWYCNSSACVSHYSTARQPVGGLHADNADFTLTDLLRNFATNSHPFAF